MRTLVLTLVLSFLAVSTTFAQEPLWALLSTEVDQYLDGGGFMDRQVLQLWHPDFQWQDDLNDVFFDPGPGILGVETGLDAFHFMPRDPGALGPPGQYFFSTEVDVFTDVYQFEDEDLLVWNTGVVTEVFDVKDILGDDFGLDAVTYLKVPDNGVGSPTDYWAFSTEVGFDYFDGDNALGLPGFSDGDILITDGVSIVDIIYLDAIFGRNVGLDALHFMDGGVEGQDHYFTFLISTEVDLYANEGTPAATIIGPEFRDEDILMLGFVNGQFVEGEVAWTGVEGFGRDVGLDALFIGPPIPEPSQMVMFGLGLTIVITRLRRKR
jgi:hypothetical protein